MVADGKEPDVDLVEETLASSGKSLDDLQAAVQLLERRRALRKQFDQGPALTKERAELEKKIITADEAFEQAERRHEATVAPLVARMSQVVAGQRQGTDAREALIESCADSELVTALAEVTKYLREATTDARSFVNVFATDAIGPPVAGARFRMPAQKRMPPSYANVQRVMPMTPKPASMNSPNAKRRLWIARPMNETFVNECLSRSRLTGVSFFDNSV